MCCPPRHWEYNSKLSRKKEPCPHYVNITLYCLSSIVHYVTIYSKIFLFYNVQNPNKKL